jgi:dolichol-phosphate mannosyltransferase
LEKSASKKINIVIPVLNEETNINPLFERLSSVFQNLNDDFSVIFVDDGSTDQTCNVVRKLNQVDSRARLVSFSRNFGHQIALTAGIDVADGDAVIMMDADLQHPPEMIPQLIEEWKKGFDVVYTIREEEENIGLFKKLTSKMFYNLFRFFSEVQIPDGVADFRLIDRKVADAFKVIRERNRFLRGLTFWVGYKSLGIKYRAHARFSGTTKYNFKKMARFAIEGITSFSTLPLIFSIYLGFFMATAGFVYGVYTLYVKVFTNWSIPGWASIAILHSTIGGIQLFIMGIVGLYIGKIYNETKQRPIYLVREKIGIN